MPHTFSLEERADGIIQMCLLDSSRETIDTWYNASLMLDRHRALARQPVFTLLDLREMGLPSPYGMARAIQSGFKTPGNLTQRIAVLVASGLVAEIGRGLIQRMPYRWHPTLQMFVDETQALDWLHAEQDALRAGEITSP